LIYSKSGNGIFVHQYIGNIVRQKVKGVPITMHLQSLFLWQGKVKLRIDLNESADFKIFLRIPGWAKKSKIQINGTIFTQDPTPGSYLEMSRVWKMNDEIDIIFEMEPRLVRGDPRVKDIKDRVAISYGPLIYCLEQGDNEMFDLSSAKIQTKSPLTIQHDTNVLGGISIIEGIANSADRFVAIPYYAWNNRGPDIMQVWHQKF
jgi:hypothetical protein